MPLLEATFWVGLTVAGTGLYFVVERASKRVRWVAWLVLGVGVVAMTYSIFAHYQQSLPKPPIWLYLVILTWVLIGFDYYEKRNMPRGEAKPFIEILAPLDRAEVGLRRIVIGSVRSPNSLVQVLVFARDGWHLQGLQGFVPVDGFAWKVDCHFGNEQSGLGEDFKLIAIADGNITGGPFLSLPTTGVNSEVVNVRRRH